MFDASSRFDAEPPALDPAMPSHSVRDEWDDDHTVDDREVPPVRLGTVAPSAGLAVELQFGTAPLDELDDAVLMDVVEGWSRVASWAQARRSRAVAEFVRRRARTSCPGGVVDELAVELRLSGRVAGRLVEHATAVNTHLTATRELWEQGLLDERRVGVIVDGVAALSSEVATRVQDTVLPKAPQQTPARLRAAVARAVIVADPAGAQERHDAARARRGVSLYPEVDGMAVLTAILAAPDAVSCYEWLTRLARGLGADDPRPMDVRRADLLVGLITGRIIAAATEATEATAAQHAETVVPTEPAAAEPAEPVVPAGPAETVITGESIVAEPVDTIVVGEPAGTVVPAEAASAQAASAEAASGAAVSHTRTSRTASGRPGTAAVSSISTDGADHDGAAVARALAADAVRARLLTDPRSGTLLDHGRTRYTPPVALAEFVRARDQRCMFPGCNRAAARCELDHTRRYPDGPTDAENLHPLCTRHHQVKHTTDWTVIAIPGGFEWTSPTGRVHRVHAHDHRPDSAPSPPVPVDLDDEPPPF